MRGLEPSSGSRKVVGTLLPGEGKHDAAGCQALGGGLGLTLRAGVVSRRFRF
jgi:hypothetical protein